MTDTPKEYLTAKEVQAVLDVTTGCLHAWRNQPGVGPPWIKEGSRFRYPREAFTTYLTALTGGAPVPRGLSHRDKLAMFGRLHDPAPSTRELATRLREVEQALLALTQIFKVKPSPEPTAAERVQRKRIARARVKAVARAKLKAKRRPSRPSTPPSTGG